MADEQKPKKAPGARPDRVRLVVLLYRKKGLSIEEFHASWRDDFAPIMSGVPIFKKNLLTYEQCHVNGEALKELETKGFPLEGCDGIAIYEALSYDKIFECLNDEEFRKIIAPEEEKLLDESRSLAFPVDIVSIFDDPT
ncbi:hypothetical protein HO173_012491 [Letharia columbiana]|uniref:EthD domain-containing protein n=1 Tax=Letharia columbiana TaxID=112416 RepID=A0A8H6CN62_9LECA|nr:uncharacterized protein HO173_012491 [Letharia columbiana]KAF6226592.1 hypothetical protein HO173_012491 [Letharia columbiana]